MFQRSEKKPGRPIPADPWRSLFIFFAIYVWNVLWMKGIIWQFTADFLQKVGKWIFQRPGSPDKKTGLKSIQRGFFALCPGFLLGVVDGLCGWQQRRQEGRQRGRRNPEAGISARGITWGWHFPCFTALSLVAKNCQKLLQVGPSETFDTSSVFITCNYWFPSPSSRWWEYLGSRNGKGHGDLWREEQQKEFSRNEDLLLCFAKAEPPCVN